MVAAIVAYFTTGDDEWTGKCKQMTCSSMTSGSGGGGGQVVR